MKKTTVICLLLTVFGIYQGFSQREISTVIKFASKVEKVKPSYDLMECLLQINRSLSKDSINDKEFVINMTFKHQPDTFLIKWIADPNLKVDGEIIITDVWTSKTIASIVFTGMKIKNYVMSPVDKYSGGDNNDFQVSVDKMIYNGVEIKRKK